MWCAHGTAAAANTSCRIFFNVIIIFMCYENENKSSDFIETNMSTWKRKKTLQLVDLRRSGCPRNGLTVRILFAHCYYYTFFYIHANFSLCLADNLRCDAIRRYMKSHNRVMKIKETLRCCDRSNRIVFVPFFCLLSICAQTGLCVMHWTSLTRCNNVNAE